MKKGFHRASLQASLFGRAGLCFAGSLLLHLISWSQPTVDYGKSYVNVTKGVNWGTNEPGDILEFRAAFVVKAGTAYKCVFKENVPANTTYIPGTLRVLTNEGLVFRQWTDASGDDPGTI